MLQHFKVVIEEEIEGGFSVHFPALPGCATQGETIEEAISNAKEALELYIWSLKDDNLPLPESDIQVILEDIEITV